MRFQNPANHHTVSATWCGFWCLLFGWLYFAKHGAWSHVAIWIVVTFCTLGIAMLIYPFFAREIVRNTYLARGWRQLD